MNEINFYNKERVLIMQLKDFLTVRMEDPKIVTFIGIVNFDFFHIETEFEAEEYDFKNLLLSLEKMYKREQKYASFNPLSPKIKIKLSENMGQIEVEVEIYNDLCTGNLQFKYGIDQSFLPELIDEIETVIKEMGITN
jgi:hypothetical protein